jgi:hypothetical protein
MINHSVHISMYTSLLQKFTEHLVYIEHMQNVPVTYLFGFKIKNFVTPVSCSMYQIDFQADCQSLAPTSSSFCTVDACILISFFL